MSAAELEPVPDVRGSVEGNASVVRNAGFGPQVYMERLRAECWRTLQAGHVDPAFRLYLQQFALLADASEVLALAAVVAPSFEESP